MRRIAFFDIDGTLTSEIDGKIPESAIRAIQTARSNGHLMFINTGRCFQNLEKRFRDIGFDGYICGCGTNIYCDGKEVLHIAQTHETIHNILDKARELNIDIIFESRDFVAFDLTRPLQHPYVQKLYNSFLRRGYEMPDDFDNPNFFCDKFVVWINSETTLAEFRKVSDKHFECIDRGDNFYEFVPHGHSKATGIQFVLDHYGLDKADAYAFGDSANDLSMLSYLDNSVAMGNASPEELFSLVSYVTSKASEDGIANALSHLGFI